MSDVRALLKAKRQEARVTHPLASYSQSGQLRCVACGILVKHSSAWEGHVGSKLTNVSRLNNSDGVRKSTQAVEVMAKRKVDGNEMDDSVSEHTSKKRKPSPHQETRVDGSSFPTNFFSNIAHYDPTSNQLEKDAVSADAQTPVDPILEAEWEKFQESVLKTSDYRETYERATLIAAPEIASETQAGVFLNLVQNVDVEEKADVDREREEAELIMDRLMDEERAQEEADTRVAVMRRKMDALKSKREGMRNSRSQYVQTR